ncbi:hypothetical protein BDK88_4385 [Natrinema hispanicum]|uniref:Uncharacterized protein n=1 Tax=Natrinema hispanicum TaxID=392421 RepID=A0A482Y0Z6_9EURY|nr:hypothetical protein BDK88_4385 [Natrinema hispanicum]
MPTSAISIQTDVIDQHYDERMEQEKIALVNR